MSGQHVPTPVIDLFAGPGGLGEGFTSCRLLSGVAAYRRALSIEMDRDAHSTLRLRSFFHQFAAGTIPDGYYAYVRGEISQEELFQSHPPQAKAAEAEAWRAELGQEDPAAVHGRIKDVVEAASTWVLCGGPPCQAYSIVGRSRRGGIDQDDARVYLYREYLKILAKHSPAVFIMENVKGLLSSTVRGSGIFSQILEDLSNPGKAVGEPSTGARYRIVSLAKPAEIFDQRGAPVFAPTDFVIRSEDYGVPQARHRVILLGVREDYWHLRPSVLQRLSRPVPAGAVLRDLPRLRSGITRAEDRTATWLDALNGIITSEIVHGFKGTPIWHEIQNALRRAEAAASDRGGEFVHRTVSPPPDHCPNWFADVRLKGFANHASRPHMASDLQRYLFASAFAAVNGRSPELRDFPRSLLPAHSNVGLVGKEEFFDDRFRVQLADKPSTTITCHLAKDGHYYIHYDPSQCRSLTVREAARLQTFPDNYYFCGTRTAQYKQVGNAVPPLLANQIASVVLSILNPNAATRSPFADHFRYPAVNAEVA